MPHPWHRLSPGAGFPHQAALLGPGASFQAFEAETAPCFLKKLSGKALQAFKITNGSARIQSANIHESFFGGTGGSRGGVGGFEPWTQKF